MAVGARKRDTRRTLSQPGWISLEGSFAARQCLVLDVSASGAKISIDDSASLPAQLRLALTRDVRTARTCKVVWRRGNSIGVRFVR